MDKDLNDAQQQNEVRDSNSSFLATPSPLHSHPQSSSSLRSSSSSSNLNLISNSNSNSPLMRKSASHSNLNNNIPSTTQSQWSTNSNQHQLSTPTNYATYQSTRSLNRFQHSSESSSSSPSTTNRFLGNGTPFDAAIARQRQTITPERQAKREELRAALEAIHRSQAQDLVGKLHLGAQVHRLLAESSDEEPVKDDFKDAGGFLAVVQMLSALESTLPLTSKSLQSSNGKGKKKEKPEGIEEGDGSESTPKASQISLPEETSTSKEEEEDPALIERHRCEVFKMALCILNEAISHHPANLQTLETLGWESLTVSLRLSTISKTSPHFFFACLLGLALGDVSSGRLSSLNSQPEDQTTSRSNSPIQSRSASNSPQSPTTPLSAITITEEKFSKAEKKIQEQWSGSIVFGKVVVIVLEFQRELKETERELRLTIATILQHMVSTRRNQVTLSSAGVGTELLKCLEIKDSEIKSKLLSCTKKILSLGISTQDARKLLQDLVDDEKPAFSTENQSTMDLLLDISSPSRDPNTIQFEMATHGHSSLALSNLRRPFPPPASSKGFTFAAHIMIDRIEPSLPLDLVHFFDAQHTCSVKLTIEPGTGQLNYQTSSEDQKTRFKNFQFISSKPYHLVLMHPRPKVGSRTSLVELYVDGVLVDQQSASWPNTPPNLGSPVRAVFGTPPSSSNSTGQVRQVGESAENQRKRMNRLIWSLGPTFALDTLLPPDLPLVLFELTSRYSGNLQDSLGRFLTYRASSNINLRLDAVARETPRGNGSNAEKDLAKHPLVTAIAGRSSSLFSEERFYFILNSANTTPAGRFPRRVASSDSSGNLLSSSDASQRPGPTLILNQALPLTRDAVAASYGFAKLYGNPVTSTPKGLDETVWKLGGCSILLRLIEKSMTTEALSKSLRLFFELVEHSWRLSEDVERVRGYEILALLLRQKIRSISPEILNSFLLAVGIDMNSPDSSALVNPFLYRIVLLDVDIWSKTTTDLQKIHLEHFSVLMRISKNRRFNVKRVARMQIVKKLLYALRSQLYGEEMVPHVVAAVRACSLSSFSEATIRVISSYLASSLCQGPETKIKELKPRRLNTIDAGLDVMTQAKPPSSPTKQESQSSAPVQIFEMLSDLILDRPVYLGKFGSCVNIKWALIFFHPRAEPKAVGLSLEILSRLLLGDDGNYSQKFSSAGGFKVLERLLPRFWSLPSVLPNCWSILLARERLVNKTLFDSFSPSIGGSGIKKVTPIACPHIMRAIVSCFKAGIRSLAARESESTSHSRRVAQPRPSDLLIPGNAGKGKHARKRSQSMNMDTKSLSNLFQATSEQARLTDTVKLIEAHCNSSNEFRDLLFSPIILRGLVDAVLPSIEAQSSRPSNSEPGAAETLCNNIVALLAKLSFESMLNSGSIAALTALLNSVPPTDLSLVSLFRTAFYSRLVSLVQETVSSTPSALETPEVAQAFAAFVEQASDEILSGSPLENDLFILITSILTLLANSASFGPASPPNRSLLVSLNRILLYRLTLSKDIRKTLDQILENQASIFAPENSDLAFLHALLNRVGFYLTEGDEETRRSSFNILKLMTLSRPSIVEPALIEGTTAPDLLGCDLEKATDLLVGQDQDPKQFPHSQAWAAFLKSLETLKGAAHLERVAHVKELLDRVDLREGAVVSTEKRMISWHSTLCQGEDLRFSKFSQDARELTVFAAVEWKKLRDGLERERSIFGPEIDPERYLRFKHDPTEGPRRMRKKLTELPKRDGEQDDAPYQDETDISSTLPGSPVAELDGEEAWDNNGIEGGHVASGSTEQENGNSTSNHLPDPLDEPEAADSGNDDKFRRVLRSLERGDIIEDVFNTSRAVGIESRGSLLIIGKKCLYLVDDVLQRRNGELVNSWEAPAEERDALVMATLTPSSGVDNASGPTGLVSQLEGDAQTRKWPWADVQQAHKRSWLHRRTAVEIFFSDGQSFLLVLAKAATAAQVYKELKLRAPAAVSAAESLRDGIKESSSNATGSSGNSLSSRLAGVLGRSQNPGALTQAWIQRKVSSFDYLMALNSAAGRSFNDITQYPVFPWLIADWESQTLDLNDPQTFRKLELPMGAQTPARRREFEERYRQLQEVDMDDSGKPFHYGTHFSTANVVCGFLIRMRPYERILMTLQGGNFDLPDRIFNSLSRAWKSASELSRGDVREMIPEAFVLPEFLTNRNRFDFGKTQTGESVDDVDLPPWAHGDPMLFIMKHREALESDFVSARLHHWIDLIFGFRSRGQEAVESTNVFHPLSYDDGVDLDAIESPLERQAAASTIHSFGQTPLRLFSNPHPQRLPAPNKDLASISSPDLLDFVEHIFLLIEGIAPIRTLKAPARFIYATHPERAFASPKDYLIIPKLGLSLSRGHLDGSVRIFSSKDSARPVGVSEQLTAEPITCFTQGGPGTILTGSEDGLVTMWKIELGKKELSFVDVFRGHSASVLCIAASPAWSIAVSGSEDSTAIIWDTNRGLYVHSLRNHEGGVHLVSIDDQNGYIATASLSTVHLWTINGEHLASVSTSSSISDPIASLAFYERDVHVGRLALLLTGHRGKVIAWSCVGTHVEEPQKGHKRTRSRSEMGGKSPMSKKPWKLEPYHVFEHHDRIGPDTTPLITSIKTTSHKLFTGDSQGRLFVWSLPGSAVALPDSYSSVCMNTDSCGKKFGVLEAKRTCSGCGGLYCSNCAPVVPKFWNGRYCSSCRLVLSSLPVPP